LLAVHLFFERIILISNDTMPSIQTFVTGLLALAPFAVAAPAGIDVRQEMASMAAKASAAPAASASAAAAPAAAPKSGLTDVDILQL
jgi:hypothetical protein